MVKARHNSGSETTTEKAEARKLLVASLLALLASSTGTTHCRTKQLMWKEETEMKPFGRAETEKGGNVVPCQCREHAARNSPMQEHRKLNRKEE